MRIFRPAALLLALTYFAFRTEIVESEREEHAARCPAAENAIASPSVTWETFDKDNAPKGQRLVPTVTVELLGFVAAAAGPVLTPVPRFHPIRDKSPPASGQ